MASDVHAVMALKHAEADGGNKPPPGLENGVSDESFKPAG
jgi:hypothetical protein